MAQQSKGVAGAVINARRPFRIFASRRRQPLICDALPYSANPIWQMICARKADIGTFSACSALT